MFDIPTTVIFKWSELDGKELKIHVGKVDDFISVVGYEENSCKYYVLYSGKGE